MKALKLILNNEHGHGQVPTGKELLKLGAIILTFPVSVPVLLLRDKIKEKRAKKKEKEKNAN